MVNKSAINCEHVWNEDFELHRRRCRRRSARGHGRTFRTCKQCKSVLEGTRNVIQLYGDERMIEVPAGFSRRLERRLIGRRKPAAGAGPRGRHGWFRSQRWC